MSTLFEILDLAGALQWTDRIETPETFGSPSWTGGIVAMTALGRRVLPDYLEDVGIELRRADDLSGADGAELIGALFTVDDSRHQQLLEGWQPDLAPGERVQLLTEAITTAPSAAHRVLGFHALDSFDVAVTEPLVRQLLDSPVAGHAALWLIVRDRADAATLGSFLDTAVRVDLLATELDDPEQLCVSFTDAPDPPGLLEDIWRHPAPETALVLDVLGSHLEDPKLAKAARKAAMRHRSWMANRP